MAGISSKAAGGLQNRYKFNDGTELNTDLDINLYETDFRSYDAQIGRFHQIDELAEFTEDYTPYHFALNNPVLLNDPLGLEADVWHPKMLPPAPPPPARPPAPVPSPTPTPSPAPTIKPTPLPKPVPENKSVGQPGLLESLIPVWGPGRAAVDDFQNGRWGWGIFNSLMVVADVATIGGASTLVKGGVKAVVRAETEEIVTKTTRKLVLNEAIDVTEEGFMHVMQRHYPRSGMYLLKSKFSISTREIVEMIKRSAQVPKILQRGGRYQRVVDAGRIIGVDATTGQATSIFTIITEKTGELVTAFPGLPGE